MIEIRHPSELNPWQTYRQASGLLKHTSRASNPDWYADAQDISRQWHIWLDGQSPVSAVFDRRSGQWFQGPPPVLPKNDSATEKPFEDDALRALHETLHSLIQGKEYGGKSKSLGVVLHLADEFAVGELAPEYAVDEEFAEVSELLISDPLEALGDSTLDTVGQTWRLLPYWGMQEGERRSVTIQLSRRYQPLVDELQAYGEARNLPVRVSGISAPLEAIRMAPLFLDTNADIKTGNIFVFQYHRFSALAVVDEKGELVQVRALHHRPGQDFPSGLGEILVNTSASVNLADPQVHIVSMGAVNQEPLTAELAAYFATNPPMNIGLVMASEIEGLNGIPGGRVEMILGDPDTLSQLEESAPLQETMSFENLAAGWASQDFYGVSDEEKSFMPSQKDLKLLKIFGMAKLLAMAGIIGLAGWTGFDLFRAMTTDAWRLGPATAEQTTTTLSNLQKKQSRVEHWENLMARRSEGWLAMEVLLDLFPPESGVLVTNAEYKVKADGGADSSKQLAFERTWNIKGFARAEGVGLLSRLSSRTYLQERFDKIAEEYGAESLRTNPESRILDATMQQRQGQLPSNGRFPASYARHFRTSFELSVNQSFTDRDGLALNADAPRTPADGSPPAP